MKKRLKKKLERRVCRMHYNDARRELLIRTIKRVHPEAEWIVITTSKSGRKITDIKIATDVRPSSMGG